MVPDITFNTDFWKVLLLHGSKVQHVLDFYKARLPRKINNKEIEGF